MITSEFRRMLEKGQSLPRLNERIRVSAIKLDFSNILLDIVTLGTVYYFFKSLVKGSIPLLQ